MKTLKGVIAATTGKGVVVPDESDLHMVPWYFVLSSGLYAVEFEDAIAPSIIEPNFEWLGWPVEEVHVGLLPPNIYRRNAVKYWNYNNTPPESMEVSLLAPVISRQTEIRYLTYGAEPEAIGVGLLAPAISRRTHPVYTIPEESISVGLLAPTITRTNA